VAFSKYTDYKPDRVVYSVKNSPDWLSSFNSVGELAKVDMGLNPNQNTGIINIKRYNNFFISSTLLIFLP
jgi:hypothetical protein